jgi:bidirectional [NiFe] hydrogenase diaphorase subunit
MTVEELNQTQADETARQQILDERIYCCTAAGCISCGSEGLRNAIASEIKAQGRADKVEVCGTGCMGMCSRPLVLATSGTALYGNVTPASAAALASANPLGRRQLADRQIDLTAPFFSGQTRIVLANSGRVDPEKLTDYIAAGGYQALADALTEMKPPEVIEEVKTSGLRGRGGAGYPTGLKWELVSKQISPTKYVVCNADEGDPGAFMDRSVLEGDPHRVLEGMAIAGYAVGAPQGYIYVRGEYGSPSSACRRPSSRRNASICWARAFWRAVLDFASTSESARGRSYAARRRL